MLSTDSVSINPRNRAVWTEAAKKFKLKKLAAIFIECSFASCQPESSLFGHLSPPYLVQELKQFASLVKSSEADDSEQEKWKTTMHVPLTDFSLGGYDKHMEIVSPDLQVPPDLQAFHPLHPYTLHPHPHKHYHDIHVFMQQYSPTTSRRGSKDDTMATTVPDASDDFASASPSSESHGNSSTKTDHEDCCTNSQGIEKISSRLRGHPDSSERKPLAGLLVVITHIKGVLDDTLADPFDESTDDQGGSEVIGNVILKELQAIIAMENDLAGLTLRVARTGESLHV